MENIIRIEAKYREHYSETKRYLEFVFKVELPTILKEMYRSEGFNLQFIVCMMIVKTRKKIHNPIRYFLSKESPRPLVHMKYKASQAFNGIVFDSTVDPRVVLEMIRRDPGTKITKTLEQILKENWINLFS